MSTTQTLDMSTEELGRMLDFEDPIPPGFAPYMLRDELHDRALTEYQSWGQAKDYDQLRELARTHYDTGTLGRFLDSKPAGYPRRVFLDELHGQALAGSCGRGRWVAEIELCFRCGKPAFDHI